MATAYFEVLLWLRESILSCNPESSFVPEPTPLFFVVVRNRISNVLHMFPRSPISRNDDPH